MNNMFEMPIDLSHLIKKRVVIYARVSTETTEQDSSYERQVLELVKSVKQNKNYNLVCVYADKESGRSTNRPAFKQMMELVDAGAVDLIITKSIARFGRNLIDVVGAIRSLREMNVELYFEKENLFSSDPTMDFTLNLLSAHAEEESNQISSNTIWAFESKMKKGLNTTAKIFGYSITRDHYSIVDHEAEIVRKIFSWYLLRVPYKIMIENLFNLGIASPTGNAKWHQRTLEDMLRNEKYVGDMLLRKKMNDRIVRPELLISLNLNQYYVSNHHEPIISRETWNAVLKLRKERTTFECKGRIFKLNPYAYFYFSKDLNKHFTYHVERHKGLYEVPVLICKNDLERYTFKNADIEMGISSAANFIINNKDLILEYVGTRIAPSSLILSNKLEYLYAEIDTLSINEQIARYSNISEVLSQFSKLNNLKKLFDHIFSYSKKIATAPNIEQIKELFTKIIFTGFKVHLIISTTKSFVDEIPDSKFLIHSFQSSIMYKYKPTELEFLLYIS